MAQRTTADQRKGGIFSRFRKLTSSSRQLLKELGNGERFEENRATKQPTSLLDMTGTDVTDQASTASCDDNLYLFPVSHTGSKKTSSGTTTAASLASTTSTPQEYLNAVLTRQGYLTARIPAQQSSFCYTPSDFQKASYSTNLDNMLSSSSHASLNHLLSSGVSRNPAHPITGDSWLHEACRAGYVEVLKECFLRNADSEVLLHCINHSGETILHAACQGGNKPWAVLQAICDFCVEQKNSAGIMTLWNHVDAAGKTPLEYVPAADAELMKSFLEAVLPSWTQEQDHRLTSVSLRYSSQAIVPLPCPPNALPMALARKVADLSLTPEEAWLIVQAAAEEEDSDDEDDDEDSDSDENHDESTYGDGSTADVHSNADKTFSTYEMDAVLASMSGKATAAPW